MTGPDGDLSSPAPLRAGTRPSSSSFAEFDGESWQCKKCPKGFNSQPAVNGHQRMHKPPKQQAEGGKEKRKAEVYYPSGMSQSRSPSRKQFKSHQASGGRMRVHNNQPQRQVQQVHEQQGVVLSRTSLNSDLNKGASEFDERETKGDGSAVAEGGVSLSVADTQNQKNFDLNKPAPADDESETKMIPKNFDLNKPAPADDESETKGDGSAAECKRRT